MKATKALTATLAIVGFSFPLGADDGGRALYETHCASCHQYDGGGVPMMQPELIGSARANGEIGGVIEMILKGSEAIEPGTSEYENFMPAFDNLTDNEIALIATYVRTHFKNAGGPVTPDDVASRRTQQ